MKNLFKIALMLFAVVVFTACDNTTPDPATDVDVVVEEVIVEDEVIVDEEVVADDAVVIDEEVVADDAVATEEEVVEDAPEVE